MPSTEQRSNPGPPKHDPQGQRSARPSAQGLGKWASRLALALLGLVTLYVGTLVYPTPMFAHSARFDGFRVYSDERIPPDFGEVIDQVKVRIEAMEHEPTAGSLRIYLCGSRRLYGFFAFLTRMSPESLAISLSAARSMFVSTRRVEEFAARNRGTIRHSRFEGNLAEVIAHEIAHFNSVRALGYRQHRRLPVWKSEGWAEYQANLGTIRADSLYDLKGRIDLLLDDGFWSGGGRLPRDLWEWQVAVEYLGEVENVDLTALAEPEVTLAAVRLRMLEWQRSTPGR